MIDRFSIHGEKAGDRLAWLYQTCQEEALG
jgi:hypothetical protein